MAMEALRNLVNHIPDWQKRLADLSGQVDRRQAELAALDVLQPRDASNTTSLGNKGPAESLEPQDDGPLHVDADNATPPPCGARQDQDAGAAIPLSDAQALPSSLDNANRLVLHKKAREAVMAAHSRALAQAKKKKKRRSASMVSAEGAPPTYRTRSIIIVYYDSYVQVFFDELVRFISSSRNLLRKARMAAKVAQIKRMAELEMPDDNASGDDRISTDSLPSLRYMSTRRLGPMCALRRSELGGLDGDDQPPGVYDELDKSLEFVQSTCEHGAHQFLRDADCDDELKKIQARMTEMLATAETEIERAQRGDAEPAEEPADLAKACSRRPISVRRDVPLSPKADAEPDESLDHPKNAAIEAVNPLQVDPDEAVDEGVDVMPPTLQYRSTRFMRSRAG